MPSKASLDCTKTISFGLSPDMLSLVNEYVLSHDEPKLTRSRFIRSCVLRYFLFHPCYKERMQNILKKEKNAKN